MGKFAAFSECQKVKCFSFRGGGLCRPDPMTRGSAPGPRWGLCLQTHIIGASHLYLRGLQLYCRHCLHRLRLQPAATLYAYPVSQLLPSVILMLTLINNPKTCFYVRNSISLHLEVRICRIPLTHHIRNPYTL